MIAARRARAFLLCLAAAGAAVLALPAPRARAGDPVEMPAPAAGTSAPKEVRGVWVVRTDLGSPLAVTRVVQHAKMNGLNTLFAQCRGRGDAYYTSSLEPRAASLEGAPGFDPLAK